ncbi:TOB3 (member of AAA-ATPase family) [Fusarium albosuccineum]|uniref:TOB3 (Member of AAA-ATPase family) n=1 Tax=Fusarium albosuccineum TaxID=1237068 RepID=A0A8H4PD92_9HYPO|nr:TOB3 (member of AAA-ATPase family) [Fusarium albosuccineum]
MDSVVPSPPPPVLPRPRSLSFTPSSTPITSSEDGHPDASKETSEPIQVGMTVETKDLYRENSRLPWQEWAPDDIDINSRSASAKFALIVRREKEHGDTDELNLALHSITVQSPLIKKQLGPVFEDYRGINTNLKKLTFRAPFHEFFYRWDKFVQARPEGDDVASSHYKLLFDIVSAEIEPHLEQASDLLKNDVVSFDYLWTLFEPGIEVYSKVDGHDRLYTLDSSKYERTSDGTFFTLSCRYVDTDGESFGFRTTTIDIWPFENLKQILELDVVPSRVKPDLTEVRERLTQRGRMFEKLTGVHHKTYSGTYELAKAAAGVPRNQYVEDERVIVDGSSFSKYVDERIEPLEPLGALSTSNSANHGYDEWDLIAMPPPPMPLPPRNRHAVPTQFPPPPRLDPGPRPLRYHPTTYQEKPKGYLDIDLVEDIVWSTTAFDQLVLQHDYKRIIRAFVDAQMSGLDDFDDLIKGKGRGIIMLLSGAPGTGKTLTSESVAEIMKKPLYAMSAGELGDVAGDVECNLHRALDLSTKWGAVLLLDECDVFLERRSSSDMSRNKLVAIFLRLLEYYQGVMFLTTNRVESFDPAFESRIHLTIRYPNLDFSSRLHIWKTFVRPGSDNVGISEDELGELAQEELNGRQIKNVVKTARLLAASESTPFAMEHVNTVLKIKRGSLEMEERL